MWPDWVIPEVKSNAQWPMVLFAAKNLMLGENRKGRTEKAG